MRGSRGGNAAQGSTATRPHRCAAAMQRRAMSRARRGAAAVAPSSRRRRRYHRSRGQRRRRLGHVPFFWEPSSIPKTREQCRRTRAPSQAIRLRLVTQECGETREQCRRTRARLRPSGYVMSRRSVVRCLGGVSAHRLPNTLKIGLGRADSVETRHFMSTHFFPLPDVSARYTIRKFVCTVAPDAFPSLSRPVAKPVHCPGHAIHQACNARARQACGAWLQVAQTQSSSTRSITP